MFFDDWTGLGRVLIVGTLAYAALVLFLRISGKRTLTKLNAFDFIVTVALGSTLATVLLSESVALAEGALAMALLIALQFAITWLSVRAPWFRALVKSEPTLIFRDGRFLETTTRGGELIDHPALYARTLKADPAGAFDTHRKILAEWEAASGPGRVVLTLDDYLAAEQAQRDLTGGLRIATFLERVVDPGIRHWAAATAISVAAIAALWALDIARR